MMQHIYVVAGVVAFGLALIALGSVLKGQRTRIFNVLSSVLAALEVANLGFLPTGTAAALSLGVTLVNLALREVTDTAAGKRE